MKRLRLLERIQKSVTVSVITVLLIDAIGVTLLQSLLWFPLEVSASEITIDSTATTDAGSQNVTGFQNVFVDDAVGYSFYRDSNGQCVYSKTTDAGANWSASTVVDSQTDCVKIVVWYDRWTPGDTTGDYIHIATLDTSLDDIFYNRLDTDTDTLWLGSSPVNTAINSSQNPSISVNTNTHAITKATDGEVYVAVNDGTDSYAVSCSASCNTTTNWNETGSVFDNSTDHNLLMPLSGGNVMVINRDISRDDVRSSVWNGTTWSSWTTVDSSAIESSRYDGGMSAVVDVDTNYIYLAYAADNNDHNTADHDIRTAVYDGTGWTNTTDVFTNLSGRALIDLSLGYDQNTGDIYVAYSTEDTIGTYTSANVYWRKSSDGMTTWNSEQGPLNSSSDEYYKPILTANNYERMYVTWWGPSADDRMGETVANIGPDTLLTATGTMISEIRSPTTDFYVGADFVITSLSSRSISSVRLTEKGTVDGETELSNIKLFYELDTSDPYDCAGESYSGTESQFGVTDTNGFSGPNGGSTFAGTVVNISPTATACFYTVLDVLSSADNGDTIDIEISDPVNEVTVSGVDIFPDEAVGLPGSTTVTSPDLTQTHYHWRNDDGSESGATSATGGVEDTPLTALARENPARLRMQVSNEGSTTSLPVTMQLEYGVAAPTCADVSAWTDVGATDDAWNMSPSLNLTNGADTTNIAEATGGVTDENTTLLTPNGAVRDTQSTTSASIIGVTNFLEMEFSVVASSSAIEGETYCFRVTDEGDPLSFYNEYPSATIDADVRVSDHGSHVTSADIPTAGVYFGGTFVIEENVSSRNVTDITISEIGSVDASNGLANVKLYYDLDTTLPYNCASESFAGTEPQFGSTDADGFSSENGTSTFSGSASITTTQSMCVYVVADVTENAVNGNTVEFEITSGSTDVVVSGGGSVAPATPITLSGSTTLSGGILTQTHVHFRNDDGTEVGATSATAGSEDQNLVDFELSTPIRLRLGISNEGSTTSVESRFRLDFAPKITTCDEVAIWTDVDSTNDAWDLYDSTYLTNGNDTTNIAEATGGVTDENTTFVSSNGGVRDTDSLTASTTLDTDEHFDLEFSITSTASTLNDTTYCFRVSANGTELQSYDNYAEISTIVKRDFRVQRGNIVITGTSSTLTAGVDYAAPSSTRSFIRITNSHHTGAGSSFSGTQNADDVTVYIENPSNIATSVTFSRSASEFQDTFVDWEIIEFVGDIGTDNEIIVHDASTVSFTNGTVNATGSSVVVADDSDVVVFITGSRNQNTSRNYYAGQATSQWNATSSVPVITRGATGNAYADISYAVVEFVGLNWKVQRVEHSYAVAGVTETESITAVNSLTKTFLHTQKRMGSDTFVLHYGHTVWLSSVGAVSFELQSGANVSNQVSVAWIIENTQTGSNGMKVQRQNGSTANGVEPLTLEILIPAPIESTNNSSIFVNSQAGGTNTNYPRPIMGARITSTSTYELWRSDSGETLTYRTEIIEWPVADLSLRQNYYRLYTDNNALTPTDPWPPGLSDLGENTSITIDDEPLGEEKVLRIRMSLRVSNANMPAGFEQFKLQFAERLTTCTASTEWTDVGMVASSTIWRGYAATGSTDGTDLSVDPPLPGDLLISLSDVSGTLEHENISNPNSFVTYDGEDLEYDWYVQQNGAIPDTPYCFRMVKSDSSPLDGYLHYPVIRTANFSPVTSNWRWYSDAFNETPTIPLANENVAPTNIENDDVLALRITVKERANVIGLDTKFKLQFSDDVSFANPVDLIASSSCEVASLWCYEDGGGTNNALISSSTLSDSDGCVDGGGNGCGTHNASPDFITGHTHGALQSKEYSFTIKQAYARVNAVYYFRLLEAATDKVVSYDDGKQYPSVVVGSSTLTFSIEGLSGGTTVAGVVTDATTTATAVDFGSLPFNDDQVAAQRIVVTTNATQGYQVLKFADTLLINSYGIPIPSVSSTNAVPTSWSTGCSASSSGCAGYHTTDATLENASSRFGIDDTYAPFSPEPQEIIFSSIPTTTIENLVFRVKVTENQPAGEYSTNIVYLAVPVF